MSSKTTESQFVCVWLLTVVTVSLTLCHTVKGFEKIKISEDPVYCEIKLIAPNDCDDCYVRLDFCDFYLDCQSEYIEVWDLDRNQRIRDGICGNMKMKPVRMTETKAILVRYKLTTKMRTERDKERCFYYNRYHHDDNPNTRDPPSGTLHSGIVTIAIGIIVGVIILIGALACGYWAAHNIKPRRTRRTRRRPASITPAELPGSDITKHPRLPNYYDNEGAVPPPYLETIDSDGNHVYTPSYYDIDPPPYSILDAEGSLETRGDTRATDRMNLSR